MKYLYIKDKGVTSLIPVNTVRIYCEENIIDIEDIVSNDMIITVRLQNIMWAEQIMEDLVDWLAKDNPNNKVFEIDNDHDR